MGCNVRDKSLRSNRKPRHSTKQPHHQQQLPDDPNPNSNPTVDPDPNPSSSSPVDSDPHHPNPNPSFDEAGWGYCTEEQLEDLLLKNLEFIYKEALSKLVSLGYEEDLALRAILRNGHCYGSMDVLSNILHNAIAYMNSSSSGSSPAAPAADSSDCGTSPEPAAFSDLRHLEEYSLAGMVCLLQQVRPHLTRGDAMWCLLMSDLHVGRASTIEIPSLPPSGVDFVSPGSGAGFPFGLCRFHGSSGEMDVECPKRFDLSPSMKSLLKRNVAMFAAGFRANAKLSSANRPRLDVLGSSAEEQQHEEEPTVGEGKGSESSDVVASVLSSLESLTLEEEKAKDGAEDHKREMIMNLVRQIRDLEEQVKERKEWAHQKAMQAARKLSNDLTELKLLRMEREETQRLKKGKQTLEDTTMKRLSEMENALRKASGQVDRANAAVRQLETENAEIRAEMEASKLSASESVMTCLEVAKREKKCLKRLLAWEKQKAKLQEDVAEERKKMAQLQQQLNQVKDAQKEAEVKWRQEIKAKEQAIAQVEEERRVKEAADLNIKRKNEALRRKIELDFQRHKDDIQRLEEELSRLKSSGGSAQLNNSSLNTLCSGDTEGAKMPKETNAKMLHGLHKQIESSRKEVNHDRECLICMKDEVSVVFLPCAHQVLCASCNEDHAKKAKACPCCSFQIEQRIRVFGAS